jgi:hypothetical protein
MIILCIYGYTTKTETENYRLKSKSFGYQIYIDDNLVATEIKYRSISSTYPDDVIYEGLLSSLKKILELTTNFPNTIEIIFSSGHSASLSALIDGRPFPNYKNYDNYNNYNIYYILKTLKNKFIVNRLFMEQASEDFKFRINNFKRLLKAILITKESI